MESRGLDINLACGWRLRINVSFSLSLFLSYILHLPRRFFSLYLSVNWFPGWIEKSADSAALFVVSCPSNGGERLSTFNNGMHLL